MKYMSVILLLLICGTVYASPFANLHGKQKVKPYSDGESYLNFFDNIEYNFPFQVLEVEDDKGITRIFKPTVMYHPSVRIPCPDNMLGCLVVHYSKESWSLHWKHIGIKGEENDR